MGYYGHRYLARLQQAEVAFITRLHPQARIAITTQQSVPDTNTPAGDTIVSDAIITLGSPNNRNGAVLPNIRLITSRNPAGVEQRFITDRHDLSAAEVVQLYRERWQIELTFRWLKQELGVIRPLGTSPEAVWLTLVIAVTVAAVLAYLEQHRPAAVSRVAFQRACGMALLMDLCAQDGSPPVPG
ncbi:MAG: transposase [Thermomicrobiales bacterium]|nr:transposase [Thermomicrobiales bacterium]